MLRYSWKRGFLPFSQKSKMYDMFFLDVHYHAHVSRFRRYNILFALSCLWAALEPLTQTQTYTHTHRIAYYCPAWAVARAGEKLLCHIYLVNTALHPAPSDLRRPYTIISDNWVWSMNSCFIMVDCIKYCIIYYNKICIHNFTTWYFIWYAILQ